MNRLLFAALLVAVASPALADNVSVTIGVNQPGLYGQITIGDAPLPPPVIYARPIVIVQAPEYASESPIYLHVPPGHERHWSKHCAEYQACGRRVFFVQHDWYNNEYAPRHRHGEDEHEHGRDKHEGHGRGEGRGHEGRDPRVAVTRVAITKTGITK